MHILGSVFAENYKKNPWISIALMQIAETDFQLTQSTLVNNPSKKFN